MPRARQIEVQIVGDSTARWLISGVCECSIQRHFQKLVEVAPAPGLDGRSARSNHRRRAAPGRQRRLQRTPARSSSWSTPAPRSAGAARAAVRFVEANARLEVEHTLTEAVTGIDIVQTQLRLAGGAIACRARSGPSQVATPRGLRHSGAGLHGDDRAKTARSTPRSGRSRSTRYRAVRACARTGSATAATAPALSYDSMLAKVIGHASSPDFADAIARTRGRSASSASKVSRPTCRSCRASWRTRTFARARCTPASSMSGSASWRHRPQAALRRARRRRAGTAACAGGSEEGPDGPEGSVGLASPIQGTIVEVAVAIGDEVRVGQIGRRRRGDEAAARHQGGLERRRLRFRCSLATSFAKVIPSCSSTRWTSRAAPSKPAARRIPTTFAAISGDAGPQGSGLRRIPPGRGCASARSGQRTARENIADLLDDGSFKEFGPLAARQTAGGVVMGVGSVNGESFHDEQSRRWCPLRRNDAGGHAQHARRVQAGSHLRARAAIPHAAGAVLRRHGQALRLRPQDRRQVNIDTSMFARFAQLSGLVPLVGINSGPCFDGNAALLGCCDVIIATRTHRSACARRT